MSLDDQTTLLDVPIDERCGKPSASGAERWFRCPGSERLIRQLPESRRDTSTEDSERGSRIHSALEAGRLDGLNEEEADTATDCMTLAREARENWMVMVGHDPGDGWVTLTEERLWDLERRVSGKADLIHLIGDGETENHALIIDYKTGRGDVVPAVGNLQLRTLAWLLYVNGAEELRTLQSVTVGIIQPLATKRVNLVRYSEEELQRAGKLILAALDDVDQFDAPLMPGAVQCEYCPARMDCPEAQAALVDASAKTDLPAIPDERLAFLLDRWGAAKKLGKDLEDEAKRRLEAGAVIEDQYSGVGYRLQPGAKMRTITDPQLAYARLMDDLPIEDFTACATIKIGELVSRFAKAVGMPRAQADREIEERLDGALEISQKAPSLKRYNPHLLEG